VMCRWNITNLTEAYNRFFFHYTDTPLLVVNSTQIDFVGREEGFEELVQQIMRKHSGIEYYSPGG